MQQDMDILTDKFFLKDLEEKEMYEILEEVMCFLSLSERSKLLKFIKGKKIDDEEATRFAELSATMIMQSKKYGHWWKRKESQIRAYRQFHCSTLIVNFDIYKQDLSRLLRRKVATSEIFRRDEIKDEVEFAYKVWCYDIIRRNS